MGFPVSTVYTFPSSLSLSLHCFPPLLNYILNKSLCSLTFLMNAMTFNLFFFFTFFSFFLSLAFLHCGIVPPFIHPPHSCPFHSFLSPPATPLPSILRLPTPHALTTRGVLFPLPSLPLSFHLTSLPYFPNYPQQNHPSPFSLFSTISFSLSLFPDQPINLFLSLNFLSLPFLHFHLPSFPTSFISHFYLPNSLPSPPPSARRRHPSRDRTHSAGEIFGASIKLASSSPEPK